ncbi:unnamed protein product [Calypogeia fissa]
MESRRLACKPRSCKPLPEELVGTILAMVPFPYIFKAKSLSKSWRARFSPVAALEDEVERERAIVFQKKVRQWSYKWETYFPVCFGTLFSFAFLISLEVPTAFAGAADCIEPLSSMLTLRMPSLSFLSEKILTCSNPEMEGTLLYWCGGLGKMVLHVANILTRSFKQLPRRPQVLGSCVLYRKKLVIQKSSGTYKAVVFCGYGRDLRAQIYDSRSQVWTTNRFLLSKSLELLSPLVHLNGVLYMVIYHSCANLMAFNVEEKTLESLRVFSTVKLVMTNVDLVVYNGRLLIILTNGFYQGGLQMLKLDEVTEQLMEVARGPPPAMCKPSFEMGERRRPVCDGSSIYFGIGNEMLKYNMTKNKWSCLSFPVTWDGAFPFMKYCEMSAFYFQPGLTPFIEL